MQAYGTIELPKITSPSDDVHPSRYSISNDTVSCRERIHAFITQTLSQVANAYFMFNLKTVPRHARIGLLSITCEEGEGESLILEAIPNDCKILTKGMMLTQDNLMSTFMIQYDPKVGIATIYMIPELVPLISMKFST